MPRWLRNEQTRALVQPLPRPVGLPARLRSRAICWSGALQKEDPIYVLSREQSIAFTRHHPDRIGKEPTIAVHDLAALGESGATEFHGFRLHLGLMRTPQQALLALQSFVRFLSTHRQSTDLEAEIRAGLRREGLAGAIDIIMHHEAREIGE